MRAFAAAMVAALVACATMHVALAEPNELTQEATDFELVKRIGSRRAWEVFLQNYPSGPYADRARKALAAVKDEPARPRPVEDYGRKTPPNWGDDVFIRKLMEKERH